MLIYKHDVHLESWWNVNHIVQQQVESAHFGIVWCLGCLHAKADPDRSILWSRFLLRKTSGVPQWKNVEFCTLAAIISTSKCAQMLHYLSICWACCSQSTSIYRNYNYYKNFPSYTMRSSSNFVKIIHSIALNKEQQASGFAEVTIPKHIQQHP